MNRDEIIRGQKVDPSQRWIGGWVGGHSDTLSCQDLVGFGLAS